MFVELIVDTVIGVSIALTMSYFHELIHIKEAKKLECLVVSKNFVKNELVIETKTPEQNKRISSAPYKILVPLNVLILGFGLAIYPTLGSIGVIVGSGVIIAFHIISYPFEGRPENVQNKSVSDKPL